MFNLDYIKKNVSDLAIKNNANLVILFGSYAKGNATKNSDIDLIIIEETHLQYLKRLDKYLYPLMDIFKTEINLFVYTPEEFRKIKENNLFIKNILKYGIIIYER